MRIPFCLTMLAAILVSGCSSIMEIKVSARRDKEPPVVRLTPDVTVMPTGAIHLFLIGIVNEDMFPSSFRIDAGGKVIYIDPVAVENSPRADYILITHGHQDHFNLPDIEKLSDADTVVIGPKNVIGGVRKAQLKFVAPGDAFMLGDIRVEVYPSYTPNAFTHPRSEGFAAYVITAGGKRIFHPGDTAKVPEFAALTNIDLALAPIDGSALGLMSTEDAAALVNSIKPVIAVPMHYALGTNATNEADRFAGLVNGGIRVELLRKTR